MRLLLTLTLALAFLPAHAGEPKKAAATYQVPYRMSGAQHVIVRAKVNGKGPYNFLLDTGAPALFVTKELGDTLKLEVNKGGATLGRFEVEGGAVLTKLECIVETPFQLSAMNALGLAGMELHGILGYTHLAHYKMELDFTRDKMTWTKLDFNPPPPARLGGAGSTTAFPGIKLLNTGKKRDPDTAPAFRGFIGVELVEADGAVSVKSVLAKSPAATAGLQAGDKLVKFQHQTDKKLPLTEASVKSGLDLHRQLANVTTGQEVRFTIVRGGKEKEITIKTGEGF